jgi:hypothetical protein
MPRTNFVRQAGLPTRYVEIETALRALDERYAGHEEMPPAAADRYNDLLDARQAQFALRAPEEIVPGHVNGFIDALRHGLARYVLERGWEADARTTPTVTFEVGLNVRGAPVLFPEHVITVVGLWHCTEGPPRSEIRLPVCYALGDEQGMTDELQAYRESMSLDMRHAESMRRLELTHLLNTARAEAARLEAALAALGGGPRPS